MLDFENSLHALEERLLDLKQRSEHEAVNLSAEITSIEAKLRIGLRDIHRALTPWQRVQIARHPKRPYSLNYIESMCDSFQPLSGDRQYRNDPAIVGGIAELDGESLMIIGHQKGRNIRENIERKFGCPSPEGYRKALRLMRLAEKFRLPVVTLVDTPGAYPGVEGEERHVAEAIAVNLREMSSLRTPIVSVVIGEGGSGGALGIALADCVLVLKNAYYSVISPEGCAAILWKDKKYAERAATCLKITAEELLELGVIEEVVEEPLGGAHRNWDEATRLVKEAITRALFKLKDMVLEEVLEERYEKFRRLGQYRA